MSSALQKLKTETGNKPTENRDIATTDQVRLRVYVIIPLKLNTIPSAPASSATAMAAYETLRGSRDTGDPEVGVDLTALATALKAT